MQLNDIDTGSRRVRLFVECGLREGKLVEVGADSANYLFSVMRLARGSVVHLFNGRDGEWSAEISDLDKRRAILTCMENLRVQSYPPDLWLAFAPLRKTRTDFVVEKAAELGVDRIVPVLCAHSNARRISRKRLRQRAVEAVEQCGGLHVPSVQDLATLEDFLVGELGDRMLVFCDESMSGSEARFPSDCEAERCCILVGPEGGFSDYERRILREFPGSIPVSLGPRILRAETATVVAIALWQRFYGDW